MRVGKRTLGFIFDPSSRSWTFWPIHLVMSLPRRGANTRTVATGRDV